MLDLKFRNIIKNLCQDQGLDYFKTLIFVNQQLKATESLLGRELNKIELSKEIQMTATYLSQYGEKEGLKANYQELRKQDKFEEEIIDRDFLCRAENKNEESDLFEIKDRR